MFISLYVLTFCYSLWLFVALFKTVVLDISLLRLPNFCSIRIHYTYYIQHSWSVMITCADSPKALVRSLMFFIASLTTSLPDASKSTSDSTRVKRVWFEFPLLIVNVTAVTSNHFLLYQSSCKTNIQLLEYAIPLRPEQKIRTATSWEPREVS